MPQPSASQVHIDAVLTNISVAYVQSEADFISGRVFPSIPVSKQTDKYFTYDQNDWFRDEAQIRPPSTESAGGGFDISTDSYSADVFAFHQDLPDQVLANADAPLNLEADAARFVTRKLLLKREIEWASTYFKTGVWSTDNTSATDWDVYATSTPLLDIQTAKGTMLNATGYEPNTLVLGYDVYAALLNHPDFVDRIKYTSSEAITQEIMARLFGVDRVFVARAIKATNIEGETAAYSQIFSDSALLAYVAPTPSLLTPSAGYTFEWTGVSDGMGMNVGVTRIEMPLKRAVRVESQMAWDSKVVAPALGYFFSDLTT
jgi:hypothetical protein